MYLLPNPQKWEKKEGSYEIPYDGKIVLDSNCDPKDYDAAVILAKDMEVYGGFSLSITRGASKKTAVFLTKKKELGSEEYNLEVSPEGITITGGSSAGLLYGISTLRQMIHQTGNCIPCTWISDYPAIPARGLYYDVTRGRVPTLDYLKKLADKMAFYKMNQLQLYIEHTYLFEDLTEMWRDDTPLTSDDILELDAYCNRLHIELVPSLSSFGHLYKLLRTKTYNHLCELPDADKQPFGLVARQEHHTVDVTNPDSMKLVKQMIEEYLPLFTSKHFNIGADETFDLGKGRSSQLANEKGVQRLYIDYVKEICEFVVSKGKIPMFWGDIICNFPEAIQELPKETICLNWGYSPEQTDHGAKALASAGATQYCCPGVCGWNQFINRVRASYENIKRMCTYAVQYKAVGILNTDWGDFGHVNHPEFGVPGMIYGASFSWNSNIPEFDEINRQISRVEYLDESETFVDLEDQLCECWVYQWRDAVLLKENRCADFEPYDADQVAKVPELLEKIEEILSKMYQTVAHMPAEKRGILKPYLIAARGMEILQKIGTVVAVREYGKEPVMEVDPKQLAMELEEWFYHYKGLWRSVSRESELHLIADVIFWYADYLRK
ncbi:MAG: glycoside hydrolase family 20 zincin-like fold domain-containing protein [Fusicatenibacter sp.]|nr:glycoside hydrolase family 20 zincin-like fold domain-containing protein [Lachnospiraceae bacterium]MDY2937027.1 glycoside hydrolase family 20 zincin-like fold domain-containing protein [Fusicatenibacter sp.]